MLHTLTRGKRAVVHFAALFAIAFIMLGATNAYANQTQVYKWVDKNGTVSFSSEPPPSGHSQSVTIHTRAPIVMDDTTDADKKSGKNAAKKSAKKASKTPERTRLTMSAAAKKSLCRRSRADITAIRLHARARQRNPDGSLSYMSETQRQRRIAMDNSNIQKYCR